MIFQHFNLLSAKTVRENVALPLKVAGVDRVEIARRVEEALRLVGWRARPGPTVAALGGAEAAGRHRPRPGERSRDPALRRGHLGPRSRDHPVDPRPVAGHQPAARPHHHPHHPRDERDPRDLHRGRGAGSGADRRDRTGLAGLRRAGAPGDAGPPRAAHPRPAGGSGGPDHAATGPRRAGALADHPVGAGGAGPRGPRRGGGRACAASPGRDRAHPGPRGGADAGGSRYAVHGRRVGRRGGGGRDPPRPVPRHLGPGRHLSGAPRQPRRRHPGERLPGRALHRAPRGADPVHPPRRRHHHRRLGRHRAARRERHALLRADRGSVPAGGGSGADRGGAIHRLPPPPHPAPCAAARSPAGDRRGFTITVVTMIGASAVAGAVGAGGLGDVAIRYGYQRFDTTVMMVVIAILIVLVCCVQFAGDSAVRRLRAR
ncbi:hypothetical protein Lal_00014214 [Lupinus albus]|nr:hypothetical protein Lal_00014214 [Lupinus albus]